MKNIIREFFLVVILFLFAMCCLQSSAFAADQDRVYIDIGASQLRKINFAVPWFVNKKTQTSGSPFEMKLADTLSNALAFHGIINIIPPAQYNGSQTANWRNLTADYAILGAYNQNGKSVDLELRLFDVAGDKTILGKAYAGDVKQVQDMLFKFCDSVINELTGKDGLCNTQIAFVSQSQNKKYKEVFLTDILGSHLRQVTRHRSLVVSPRFKPGNIYLSYSSYHSGNQNLYITDLRQNVSTRVLSQRLGMNLAPAWAPDGNSFILTLSYQGNPDLYLLDKQGQILKRLTKDEGINVSASYSPDGSKFVFVSDRSGSPQLYVHDVASGNEQRITFTGKENAEPSWHPSENLIVYSSLRNGIYQIFVQKAELGAEEQQLTTDQNNHENPSWSPDGSQIIFTKQEGKDRKIYAMMKNGSFQRKIFDFPGSQTYPRWAANP